MARGKSGGGPFVGMIFHFLKSADNAYARGDGYAACGNLVAVARLVKAKMPQLPFKERNPYYSPQLQAAYNQYYVDNVTYVAGAVREYIDSHGDSELGVNGDEDGGEE